MYSAEQRKLAIETFIKFDHSIADTIAELGYPNRHTLYNWWKEYKATGVIPVAKFISNPRFTEDKKRAAVDYYLEHGRSLARTMRAMGYPKSRVVLCEWIDEFAPGRRKYRGPNVKREAVPLEKKIQVVAELEARSGPASAVAERYGVSRIAPYAWRQELMSDNEENRSSLKKGIPVSKSFDELPDDIEVLKDMLRETKLKLRQVQLELDVRQATLEIVKKDPGTDPNRLTNQKKTALIEVLRTKYKLRELLASVGMAKSSYEYA